jgi:hypothetical protein
MGARRVAIGHVAERGENLGQDRRRAGVVEIDPVPPARSLGRVGRGWDPAAGSAL